MEKKRHYTVTVFLITADKPAEILLVYHQKYGVWMPPGGHQENCENPWDTAIREVFEETGIDISDYFPQIKVVDERVNRLPLPDYLLEEKIPAFGSEAEHFHLDQVYLLNFPKTGLTLDPGLCRWFTKNQLKELKLLNNIRLFLEKYL